MRSVRVDLKVLISALAIGIVAIAARPAPAAVTDVFIEDVAIAEERENGSFDVEVAFSWSADLSAVEGYRATVIVSLEEDELSRETFGYDDSTTSAVEIVSVATSPIPGDPQPQPGDCLNVRVEVRGFGDAVSFADDVIANAVCLEDPTTEEPLIVPVDIKPGSCPNPIKTGKPGVVPVAICGIEGLDVLDIDPASICLMGVKPIRFNYEDVATPYWLPADEEANCLDCTENGGDGFMDLTLKFDAQELVEAIRWYYGIDEGGLEDRCCLILFLDGNLYDGTSIAGEDVVRLQDKGEMSKGSKSDNSKSKKGK